MATRRARLAVRLSASALTRYIAQQSSDQNIAISLQHLAVLAGLAGNVRRAAALLAYVDVRYREIGMERESTERRGYEKLAATVREQMGEGEISRLAAQGAAWSEEQAVDKALRA